MTVPRLNKLMRYCRALVICLILLCPFSALALVNINTASLDELDTLPGVGPSTAEKIVAARPFSSTSEIQNVQGIGGPGSKTYEDIIGLITVNGGTTVVLEDEDEPDTESTDDVSVDSGKEVHEPVNGLLIKAPTIAFAGQLVEFDVNPTDGTDDRLVRYSWNFGDGSISAEKSPRHQYPHPGTYVIVVESYFQKQAKVARREISVVPLALELTPVTGGGLSVKNAGVYEVDLSDLTISSLGEFVFPKHTILLPGKSLVIESVSGSTAQLKDVAGKTLAYGTAVVNTVARPKSTILVSAQSKTPVGPTTVATSTEVSKHGPEVTAVGKENVAAVSATGVPGNAWPYLGLLAVMTFGFVALFGVGRT